MRASEQGRYRRLAGAQSHGSYGTATHVGDEQERGRGAKRVGRKFLCCRPRIRIELQKMNSKCESTKLMREQRKGGVDMRYLIG